MNLEGKFYLAPLKIKYMIHQLLMSPSEVTIVLYVVYVDLLKEVIYFNNFND